MAKKRKKIIRGRSKPERIARPRHNNQTASFLLGVLAVLLIGFLIFQYAQTNNYKNIPGERSNAKIAPK